MGSAVTVPNDHDGQHSELTVTYPTEGVCVVRVEGELDMLTSPTLQHLLSEELGSRRLRALVVDLSGCEFMGSAGVAALVAARDAAIKKATAFALAGMNRGAARVLEATGLKPLFDVYPTTRQAMAVLSAQPSGPD
jgi:anti-anti-sigma factor